MSLTVDVLPLDPCPLVRLDVAVSGSWRVVGRAGDEEWLAGEGAGGAVFADPWAPLGRPVTYMLTGGSSSWVSDPVVRSYRGNHAVTDLSGRMVADVRWMPGDPWGPVPRASFFEPWGSSLPVSSVAPVAGMGGGAVRVKTVPPHTRTLVALVEANRPLLLHHNALVCGMPDCDVPAVRTILLTGVDADRSGRVDVSERVWDLSYRLVPRPHEFRAPVATWADVLERWETAGELAASGLSNADLLRGDWLVDW